MYSHTVLGIYLPCDLCHASADCRDTEWWEGLRWGRGLWGFLLEAQSAPACPGPCPVLGLKCLQDWRLQNLLGKHTPVFYHLTSRKGFFFFCISEISCILICPHGLSSCHWILLSKAWLYPLHSLPADTHTYQWDLPWAFSSAAQWAQCSYCHKINMLLKSDLLSGREGVKSLKKFSLPVRGR